MRQFHIFHSTGIHRFNEVQVQPRVYAGYVEAESLEAAYCHSQNPGPQWEYANTRSTSVGDVIQDGDSFFMVCGMGFKELVTPEENEPELEYQQ